MKTKFSMILLVLQAVAALCALGAVKLWAPVCDKMLELANGNQVHMKCFYTGQATVALSVVLLVCAVMAFLAKKDHKKLLVVNAVGGAMLFLLFTSLIGVCASEAMSCQTTALWGKLAAAVIVATSVAGLFTGKDGQIPD